MNTRWVLFHLGEARRELDLLTKMIETGAPAKEEFEIALEHAYHHLNTAWNSRSISDDQAARHTDEDFVTWRQFPKELNLA